MIKSLKNNSKLFYYTVTAGIMSFFLNTQTVLANQPPAGGGGGNGSISTNKPTVSSDGTVSFGNAKSINAQDAAEKVYSNLTFWIGLFVGLLGLFVIGYGVWRAFQAYKSIAAGNQQGWGDVRNLLTGVFLFGILCAVIGTIIVLGTTTGNSLFG